MIRKLLIAMVMALPGWCGRAFGSLYCVVDLSGGTTATSYPVAELADVPDGGWSDEYRTTKLVLRRIESGTFQMQKKYDVTLTRPFYIGIFEVTQKQYELVMGSNPSYYKGDMRPVEKVSRDMIRGSSAGGGWPTNNWVDADSFLGKLREKTELDFDLPTESQWEYACRAGTTSLYNNGGSSSNDLKLVERYADDGVGGGTTKVGSYLPNAWGLYDMHGNVREMCLDRYGSVKAGVDPKGKESGSSQVSRGGGYSSAADSCTSFSRLSSSCSSAYSYQGFRLSLIILDDVESSKLVLAESSSGSMSVDTTFVDKTKTIGPISIAYGSVSSLGCRITANGSEIVNSVELGTENWSSDIRGENALLYSSGGVEMSSIVAAMECRITYDANGGGSTPPASTKWGGFVFGTLPSVTRQSYDFLGWYTEREGGCRVTTEDVVDSDCVLYAHWRNHFASEWCPGGKIDICSGVRCAGETQRLTMDSDWVEKGFKSIVLVDGVLWQENIGIGDCTWAGSQAKEYTLTHQVVDAGGAAIGEPYVAKFNWINRVTVTFECQNGETAITKIYDEASVYGELPVVTRTGYAFDGWYTAASGGAKVSEADIVSGVMTLYAHWISNRYSIRFHANGGEGQMEDQSFSYDNAQDLSVTAFTRTGYTFAGWATSAGGQVAYGNGQSVKNLTSDANVSIDLYAVWNKNTYSVKFNANGGSGSMSNEVMTYDAGKTLTLCAFTKTGYTFAGWATSAGGEVVYGNGQSVKNLAATQGAVINLYAKWTANAYVVAFDANGGTGTMENQTMVYDTANALTANAFTRVGYTLAGWEQRGAAGVRALPDCANVKNLTDIAGGTVTLYAKWTPNNYVIDFNPGQGGTGTMSDQPMTYDEEAALMACAFTKTGYTFAGWAVGAPGGRALPDGESVKNLTDVDGGVVTLYATWTVNAYTVKFNANGGKGTMVDQVFLYDAPQNLTSNGFVRAGCEFLGWAVREGADSTVYVDGEIVCNLTAEADGVVNLYAVWDVTGLVDPAETYIDVSQGEVAPYAAAATVYDGYLYDGDNIVGSVQVKVAKMKNGSAKVTATVQLTGDSKKVSFKGGVADGSGRVTGLTAAGHALDISLGVDGMGGTMDGKAVDGARNLFSAKDADSKSIVAAIEKKWVGAVNVVGDDVVLSVTIAKKGKVKIAGTVKGVKVSATSQLLVGAEACCVPVVITKKANLAFNLWLMPDGTVEVRGADSVTSGEDAASPLAGKAGALNAGAAFRMDYAAFSRALTGLYGDYLPNGVGVTQSGAKWVVAGGAKAGKLALVKGTSEIDSAKSKFTDNMSGLKLTYKAKDGSFKGSFKAYALENGKIKSYTVNVTGVMIGAKGYGTATLKKPSCSFAITIE